MKLITLPVTYMQVNCYICYDEKSLEGVVIDPGGESEKIMNTLNKHNVNLKYILLTHGHWDHIGAVEKLAKSTDAKIVVHKNELEILKMFADEMHITVNVDIPVDTNDVISFGDCKLVVLYTPGHTPGGCCYYNQQAKVLFTGDTLFCESVGRTDFEYSNPQDELDSILNVIYKLPEDVTAYPGHGPKTTIAREMQYNPFVGRNGLR